MVALEIHGDIMASGALTLPLMQKSGRDSIKVNYDTGNCELYGGVCAVDDLATIASELEHVHLKDTTGGKGVWNFPALGSGVVDFSQVLSTLNDASYSGPYSVELEFEGEPWPSLQDVNQAMKLSYEYLNSLSLS